MNQQQRPIDRRTALARLAATSLALTTANWCRTSYAKYDPLVTALSIDGKAYSATQMSDESREDVRQLPFVAVTAESLKARSAFGFTNQRAFEHWCARAGLAETYSKLMASQATVDYAPEREAAAAKALAAKIDEATDKLLSALKANNVSPNDGEGILNLVRANKVGRSMTLYQYPGYEGRVRYFPSNAPVPNYSWLDFNNMASSAVHHGNGTFLCQQKWFGPKYIALFGYIAVPHLGDAPFYFNNLASSSTSV